MSIEIATLNGVGSRNTDLTITRYYGGKDKGACFQLSSKQEDGNVGYVQVSKSDIKAIVAIIEREGE